MVKVTGTSSGRDVTFDDGVNISVNDGHLFVYEGGGGVGAIFAPNTWRDAVVEFPKSK